MIEEDNCIGNAHNCTGNADSLRNDDQSGNAYLMYNYVNGNFPVGFTPFTSMASEEQGTFIEDRLLKNSSFSFLLSMVTPPAETNLSRMGETISLAGDIYGEFSVSCTPDLAPMTPEKPKWAHEDRAQRNTMCLETNNDGFESVVGEQVVQTNCTAEVIDAKESEAIGLNKKAQSKTKRKKHRPKVITESKPRVKKKEFNQSNKKRKYTKRNTSKDEISALVIDENKPKKRRTPRKKKQPTGDATFQIPETPDKVEIISKRNRSLLLNFNGGSFSCSSDFMTPVSNKNKVIENDACQSSMASHSPVDLGDIMGFSRLLMAQENKRVRRSLNFSTDEGIKSFEECCSEMQSMEENRCSFRAIEKQAEMSAEYRFPCHYANGTFDACVSSNAHEPMNNTQFWCFPSKDKSFPLKGPEHGFLVSHSSKEIVADSSANDSGLLKKRNGVEENSESLKTQALVVYSQNNQLVPLAKVKKRQRGKVLLDERTTRVWKLLMDNINNEGVDGTGEEETEHWRNERNIFLGRANNFIAKMHLVQGDRRFSCWKGSVVDSVVGVFLTQNVADNLSSSAFMSMAARFPNKVKEVQDIYDACFHDNGKEVEEIYDCYFSDGGNHVQESCDRFYEFYKAVEAAIFPINSNSVSETSNDGFVKSNEIPKSDCSESSHASNEAKEPQRNSNLGDSNSSQESSFKLVEQHEAKELQRCSNLGDSNSSQESSFPVEQLEAKELQSNSNLSGLNCLQESSLMLLKESDAKEHQMTPYFGNSNGSRESYLMPLAGSEAKEPQTSSYLGDSNGSQESSLMPLEGSEAKEPQTSSYFCDSNGLQESYLMLPEESEAKEPQTNPYLGHSNGSQDFSLMPLEGSEAKEPQMITYPGDSNGSQETSLTLTPASCDDKSPPLSALNGIPIIPNYDSLVSGEVNMRKLHSEAIENEVVQSMESIAETPESMQKAIDSEEKVKKINEAKRKAKSRRVGDDIKENFDWNELRKQTIARTGKTKRSAESEDTLDWEAVRCADIEDVAGTIRERGMNNMLAERIKAFLDKLVIDFGSIDLEWIRDIPPHRAKEYLLTIRGLGLKSVECLRLLTLHQHAFPVDTNVGRIAVRLGWVPIHPLPESLQLHLLELYPILDSIQKYLWPRLCKLDQATLYELHYQMITFGKVFCTKSKPNCNACPMRTECRHFASAFASARLALPSSSTPQKPPTTAEILQVSIHKMFTPFPTPDPKRISLNEDPVVEHPPESPERQLQTQDSDPDDEDIPSSPHSMDNLTQNLQEILNLQDGEDLSKAIVALSAEAASIPTPKLKNISRLRTEHLVYEIPDSHPLASQLEAREPDDPSFYLFAMWGPGEAQAVLKDCDHNNFVFGTLLIPCRTAMRGRFPLNGTNFQVNEVFADQESSQRPIPLPRNYVWNLHRRTVYFGTSVSSIFKGLMTEEIQRCFWTGFVCVRGFDRETRGPRPLMRRLHLASSKYAKEKTAQNPPAL